MASNVSSGQEVFCKLDQYFGGLGQALSTRDGKRLAAVLSLNAVSKKLAYDISAMVSARKVATTYLVNPRLLTTCHKHQIMYQRRLVLRYDVS